MLPEIVEDEIYVYFWLLRHEDCDDESMNLDPIIKIGITKDWVKRRPGLLSQLDKGDWPDWLAGGYGTSDELLGVIKGGRKMEKYLHTLFEKHAAGNEFFWYSEIEADIDDILDEHCICSLHTLWNEYVTKYQ